MWVSHTIPAEMCGRNVGVPYRPFTWFAQPEPAPSGFVYGVTLPTEIQLRRLIYNVTARPSLGTVTIPISRLDPGQIDQIKAGFADYPPMLAFFIAETEDSEPCDSYVHIPLRVVPTLAEAIDGVDVLSFEIRLTPQGFTPDPCNNSPF